MALSVPGRTKWTNFVANYLAHPLFIPLYAYGLYWPSMISAGQQVVWLNFVVIFLVLVGLPLMIYPVLRQTGKVASIHLRTAPERVWPLLINLLLWSCLISYFGFVLPKFNPVIQGLSTPLMSFFIGGTLCILGALIAAIIGHKSSLHMMGISGLVTHLFLRGNHFILGAQKLESRLFWVLGLILIIWIGLVRYRVKAHTPYELVTGTVLGIITQLLGVFTLEILWP